MPATQGETPTLAGWGRAWPWLFLAGERQRQRHQHRKSSGTVPEAVGGDGKKGLVGAAPPHNSDVHLPPGAHINVRNTGDYYDLYGG